MHDWVGWVAGVALLAVWFVVEIMSGGGLQTLIPWAVLVAVAGAIAFALLHFGDGLVPLKWVAYLAVGIVLGGRVALTSRSAAVVALVAWAAWGLGLNRWARRAAQSSSTSSSSRSS